MDKLNLGKVQNRTLTIREGLQSRGVETDAEGRKIYTALAYGYDDGTAATIDTYGTTMARGAMAHVSPNDFRILEYHQQSKDPVGKPVSIEDTPEGPLVRFVFADTDRAQELQGLVDGGFIRGVSVGFIPTDGYARKDGTVVFTKVDLHELSLVNAPSSKKALIDLSRELGTDEADLADLYADVIRPATPVEEAVTTSYREYSDRRRKTLSAEGIEAAQVFDRAYTVATPVEEARDAITGIITRAGSDDTTAALSLVLQLLTIIDTAADVAQDVASDALGVENPDDAQDAALEAGDLDDDNSALGTSLEMAATVTPVETVTVARSTRRRPWRR